MFKKILVCLDGSNLAEQILPYAKEQALKFNSKVVLLQVMDVPATVAWIQGTPPDANIVTEKSQKEEKEVKAYLEHIATQLRASGLDVEDAVMHNIATSQTIMDYADQNEIDLIAITTRGRSGLVRAVLGSVADFVIRESGLPIMLIKPQDTGT